MQWPRESASVCRRAEPSFFRRRGGGGLFDCARASLRSNKARTYGIWYGLLTGGDGSESKNDRVVGVGRNLLQTRGNVAHVGRVDDLQIDDLQINHLDPSLPF